MFDLACEKPTVISLFSGCGGLDFGFSSSGFEIVGAFDSDAAAIKCYNSNHTLSAKNLEIDDSLSFDIAPDVVIAGPPCQGFSTGGGYTEDDPRNSLLLSTCRIIARTKPRLAVIENVAALTNRRNDSYLQKSLEILRASGFYCQYAVLSASDYGVPQRRRRTVIIARRDNEPFAGVSPKASEMTTVGDALVGLVSGANNHHPKFPSDNSKHHKIAMRIGPEQKLCNVRAGGASVPTWDVPECFGEVSKSEQEILEAIRSLRRRNRKRNFGDADPVLIEELQTLLPAVSKDELLPLVVKKYLRQVGDAFDLKNTFNGKYRRLSATGFSPTVDTRFGDIQLFLHPTENRSLTVREAARIQGFPDDFCFPEDDRTAYRLIGNAVPPPLARSLADFCKELL